MILDGGQRIATVLVYLNDVVDGKGGHTRFTQKGVEVSCKPVQGTAVVFFPAFLSGQPDPRTIHEAQIPREDKVGIA